jgi:multiple sugar transport system ATP-binding protein
VTEAHTELGEGDIVKIRPQKPYYFNAAGERVI